MLKVKTTKDLLLLLAHFTITLKNPKSELQLLLFEHAEVLKGYSTDLVPDFLKLTKD